MVPVASPPPRVRAPAACGFPVRTVAARVIAALALLAATSAASAVCQAPDTSLNWVMVGEITQNVRTVRHDVYDTTGWSTVDAVTNLGTTERRETLSGSFSDNQIVSFAIQRWGIGTNSITSRTHSATVTVPPQHRARLVKLRREEVRDLVWDVVCAWRHRITGTPAITVYGFGYRGTTWRAYDAFEVRWERV
jgi:hypothetical protein